MDYTIIGADIGYENTKTSEKAKFPSRVTKVEPILPYGKTLELDGVKYYVGIGNGTYQLNKIDNELTKVLLIYGLCASTRDERIRVVTGLPIMQYKSQREQLRKMILDLKTVKCIYCGSPRTIIIDDVLVRPQGVLGGLTVDIGSRTVDISYVVDGELRYYNTIYNGLNDFFTRIIHAVNDKFTLALDESYGYSIVKDGLCINDDDKKKDLDFIEPIKKDYANMIDEEIVRSKATCKATLCGGGAELLQKEIKFPSILATDPQFANAHQFKAWGNERWGVSKLW
jgi:plasmid segregation protein ParM